MRERGNRDQVIIATKAGGAMGGGPNEKGLSRLHLRRAVEDSLRRLQTDYIDLYQAHYDDPETPLEETMSTCDDLIRQGKVRYSGASNYNAWRLTRALWVSDKHDLVRYESIQPPYHLLKREEYERELEPLCREQEIGVITYSSLAGGFLTGKYRPDKDLPTTQRASSVQSRYMNERGFAVLDQLDQIAARVDATPAQVALAWIIARPGITAPIASATTPEQTHDLLRAVDLHLDKEAITALDKASDWR